MGVLIIHCNYFNFCFYFIDYEMYACIPLCGNAGSLHEEAAAVFMMKWMESSSTISGLKAESF